MKLTTNVAKRRLFITWSSGTLLLFLLLILQSVGDRYDSPTEVWSWFLPTVMPTLSLMIGILVADSLSDKSVEGQADVFLFRVSFALSVFYLLVVSLSILLAPFSEMEPVELMNLSNLWLAPLQGLVVASLGAFFRREKIVKEKAPKQSSGDT